METSLEESISASRCFGDIYFTAGRYNVGKSVDFFVSGELTGKMVKALVYLLGNIDRALTLEELSDVAGGETRRVALVALNELRNQINNCSRRFTMQKEKEDQITYKIIMRR